MNEYIFQFRPYDADIIPIKQDSYGVVVEDIEKILKERKQKMQQIPKVYYVIHYYFLYFKQN